MKKVRGITQGVSVTSVRGCTNTFAGAALEKDAGSDPILTPNNQKVLGVIDRCGKK